MTVDSAKFGPSFRQKVGEKIAPMLFGAIKAVDTGLCAVLDPKEAVGKIASSAWAKIEKVVGNDRRGRKALRIIDQLVSSLPEVTELAGQTFEEAKDLTTHFGSEIENLIRDRRLEPEDVHKLLYSVMEEDYDSISPKLQNLLNELGIPAIYCEMLQGIRAMNDIPMHNKKIRELGHEFHDSAEKRKHPQIFITGEGSSVAIPGKLALQTAEEINLDEDNIRLSSECCGEMLEKDVKISRGDMVVVVSNSGKTDTAVKLAQKAKRKGAKVVAITKDEESELAKIAGEENTIVLNCGTETAVGATKSVVESAMVLTNLVRASGRKRLNKNLYEIADSYLDALTQDIPQEFVRAISLARRLVVIGSDGVHREAALKVAETIGVPVRIIDRPFGLHGDEETFRAGDAVLFVEPYEGKMDKIQNLIGKRGIPLFYITSNEKIAESLPPSKVIQSGKAGLCQSIINLGVVQKLLVNLAIYKGSSCVPKHARKVGDAVEA